MLSATLSCAATKDFKYSWTANTETDLAGYNVYVSTTSRSGPFTKVNSELITDVHYTYVHTYDANNQIRLWAYATAENTEGLESDPSNMAVERLCHFTDTGTSFTLGGNSTITFK